VSTTPDSPLVVVAMGGHAFMQKGEAGSIEEHERNALTIASLLLTLVDRNGPQVGQLLLQHAKSRGEVPQLPLDVLVAMTEGSLGYILQQAILNQLRARGSRRYVVTVVTQVLVDPEDPAFKKPSKPIGPFLTKAEAERRRDALGWKVKADAGRGWRRLVASPRPIKVIQRETVREAARAGHVVIACGGGGIPIKKEPDGTYAGVEAVIDKDLTSALLATEVGASLLVILTAVPQVYVDFGKQTQKPLGAVTLEEIEQLRTEGHFEAGSMGPKIEAVIAFLKAGGRRALITNPDSLTQAIEGRAGTHFIGGL